MNRKVQIKKVTIIPKSVWAGYIHLTRVIVDGNMWYYYNGKNSTRDELNNIWLEKKKFPKEYKFETVEKEETLQELFDNIMLKYDKYVDYIENGEQWRRQKELNNEAIRQINVIKEALNMPTEII